MNKLYDKILILLVFLQFSDLYKVLIYPFNVTTQLFSIITIFITFFYIISNKISLKRLLNHKILRLWLWLVLYLPITINLVHFIIGNLSLNDFVYWFSFLTMMGFLFLSTTIYFYKNSYPKYINQFFQLVLLSIVISLFIGWYDYEILRSLVKVSADLEEYMYQDNSRAIGFYTQSNMLARSILFTFIIFAGTILYRKSSFINYNFIVLFTLMLLLTGSRTSMILFLIFLIFYIPRFSYKKIFSNSFNKKLKVITTVLTIPIAILFTLLLLNAMPFFSKLITDNNVYKRFSFITDTSSNSSLEKDRSVNARIIVFNQYISKIIDQPLIGYGSNKRSEYIKNNTFLNGSQNQYLENAFSFGIFYVTFFFYVFFYTIKKLKFDERITFDRYLYFKIFLLLIIIYGFSVNYLLINRLFLITTGFFLGIYMKSQLSKPIV